MRLEKILLTHAHIDHAGGTAELARSLKLPIEGPHRGDQFWIDGLPEQSRMSVSRRARRSLPTTGSTMAIACRWAKSSSRCCTARATRRGTSCSSRPATGSRSWATCCRGIDRADGLSGWRLRHADRRHPHQAAAARRRRALRARTRADVDVRRGTAQQPVRSGIVYLSDLRRPRLAAPRFSSSV